jgi:hypothetical protein
MQRGRRQPPSPRRAGAPTGEGARESVTPDEATAGPSVVGAPADAGVGKAPPAVSDSPTKGKREAPLRLSPSLPWANLAIRVRRPLDDRLADLIHELRREGFRTSKVEVIEMLLWELPGEDPDGLRRRITRFRRHAPRSTSAELDG